MPQLCDIFIMGSATRPAQLGSALNSSATLSLNAIRKALALLVCLLFISKHNEEPVEVRVYRAA